VGRAQGPGRGPAGRYDVDLSAAFAHKLALNAERYPVDKARGSNRKYTEL